MPKARSTTVWPTGCVWMTPWPSSQHLIWIHPEAPKQGDWMDYGMLHQTESEMLESLMTISPIGTMTPCHKSQLMPWLRGAAFVRTEGAIHEGLHTWGQKTFTPFISTWMRHSTMLHMQQTSMIQNLFAASGNEARVRDTSTSQLFWAEMSRLRRGGFYRKLQWIKRLKTLGEWG